MHACFIVEIGPAARKMQPIARFWGKLSALSLRMAIFQRLNAIFIAFYMPNVVHIVFRFETSTAARKMQPFTRFWRKLSALSLQMATFQRLNAIFVAFYMPNAVHVVFSIEISTAARKS